MDLQKENRSLIIIIRQDFVHLVAITKIRTCKLLTFPLHLEGLELSLLFSPLQVLSPFANRGDSFSDSLTMSMQPPCWFFVSFPQCNLFVKPKIMRHFVCLGVLFTRGGRGNCCLFYYTNRDILLIPFSSFFQNENLKCYTWCFFITFS